MNFNECNVVMHAIVIDIIIFAYLGGSVSSAILHCRIANLPDLYTESSGNSSATNLLRLSDILASAEAMVFDILKGMIPYI